MEKLSMRSENRLKLLETLFIFCGDPEKILLELENGPKSGRPQKLSKKSHHKVSKTRS